MKVHVVIPVIDEPESVGSLIEEFAELPTQSEFVFDFIDDSKGTQTIDAIDLSRASFSALAVTRHRRTGDERTNQLVGAVVAGMRRAKLQGVEYVFVMDGDGQHPPATLLDMHQKLMGDPSLDVVVASRYMSGGSHEGLDGGFRRFVSWSATRFAKALFPYRLRGVSDPMTGFFAVRLSRVPLDEIEATKGFKILLDILLMIESANVAEVPVIFRARKAGVSKAVASRGVEYIVQLCNRRMPRFKQATPKVMLQRESA